MTRALNRSAALVRPRQPYLAWARQHDPEGLAETVFELLREEPTVYLLPEWEDPETAERVLDRAWPRLFEALLEGWSADASTWPETRTREQFAEWFEVEACALVVDLSSEHAIESVG